MDTLGQTLDGVLCSANEVRRLLVLEGTLLVALPDLILRQVQRFVEATSGRGYRSISPSGVPCPATASALVTMTPLTGT